MFKNMSDIVHRRTNVAVSIIVPVYNAEKYLEKCLDSIVQQTLKDIEIILIDDGSKDGSATICKKYCELDDRFTYYRKENEGLAAARQDGLERAKGEYIGFVDSDDWLELNMYARMYTVAKQEDADIVFCNCFVDDDVKNPVDLEPGSYNINEIGEKILSRTLAGLTSKGANSVIRWSNCLRIYKKNLIDSHGIKFDRRFRRSQDLPFTFEATLCSTKYVSLNDEFLYHNRSVDNDNSLSRGYTENYWGLINPLIERLYGDIERYGRVELIEKMHLSTFFFANQGILNECEKSCQPFKEKLFNLKMILDDEYVKESLTHINKKLLNQHYQGIYDCLKCRTELQAYVVYKLQPIKTRLMAIPRIFTRKVLNNRFVEPIYLYLRRKIDKNYSVSK